MLASPIDAIIIYKYNINISVTVYRKWYRSPTSVLFVLKYIRYDILFIF